MEEFPEALIIGIDQYLGESSVNGSVVLDESKGVQSESQVTEQAVGRTDHQAGSQLESIVLSVLMLTGMTRVTLFLKLRYEDRQRDMEGMGLHQWNGATDNQHHFRGVRRDTRQSNSRRQESQGNGPNHSSESKNHTSRVSHDPVYCPHR